MDDLGEGCLTSVKREASKEEEPNEKSTRNAYLKYVCMYALALHNVNLRVYGLYAQILGVLNYVHVYIYICIKIKCKKLF